MRAFLPLLTAAACTFSSNTSSTDSTDTGGTSSTTNPSPTGPDPTSEATSTPDPTSSSSSSTTSTSTTSTSTTSTSSSSASSSSTSDGPDTGDSSGVRANTLVIEGLGEYPVTCELSDAHCGARTACELVTNEPCEWVEYDCASKKVGSYVIADYIDQPENFSFGLYPLGEDDYGNICACQGDEATGKAFLQTFGVGTGHVWCGLGWWYLKD